MIHILIPGKNNQITIFVITMSSGIGFTSDYLPIYCSFYLGHMTTIIKEVGFKRGIIGDLQLKW